MIINVSNVREATHTHSYSYCKEVVLHSSYLKLIFKLN